ncbi:MAG: response regulator [Phycisphaeraceae bacterium]
MARILLIDDDELLRGMVHKTLQRAGFEVVDACDGKVGLERMDEGHFDLVITDMVMPEQEGIETVLALRAKHPQLPILAISGGGRGKPGDYLAMASKLGAAGTLAKPFDNDELIAVVKELLGSSRGAS